MKNKKSSLFVRISSVLFVLSAAGIIAGVIVSCCRVKSEFPGDSARLTDALAAAVFSGIWMAVPGLASELSFIRSVDKLLTLRPAGGVKRCYIVSVAVAFIAFAFMWLVFSGLAGFESVGTNFAATALLFIEWPAFILSFILGSVKPKQAGKTADLST